MASGAYVGRHRDLEEVRRSVAGAVAGRGGLVLVSGEPGIGKTSFAVEAVQDVGDDGAELLWATCWDGAGAPPYWPWVQILRAHAASRGSFSAEVAQMMPEITRTGVAEAGTSRSLRPADGPAERFALFDAVASLLLGSARVRPLVLVIDDLQWADVSSLLLLDFLSTQLSTCPMLVLALFRDTELLSDPVRSGELANLRHHGELISLGGLDEEEVDALVAGTTGRRPGPGLVSGILHRTAGNPFFVREIAALLGSHDSLEELGQGAGPLPESVRQVVRQRLARLPQACVAVLAVAAVAGQESSADLLAQAARLPVAAVTEHLELAGRARVLTPVTRPAGTYRFAHDLFREAVYEGLAPSVRVDLHLRLAEALEGPAAGRAAGRSAELAAHFLLAAVGTPDDPALAARAARHGRSAGQEAGERLAYEDAVAHFTRTLDGLGDAGLLSDGERADLLADRGDALRLQGALVASAADYRAAGAAARSAGNADALGRAALGIHRLGVESGTSRNGCIAVLEEALGCLGQDESALRTQVLAALARELALGDLAQRPRAAELGAEAVDLARRLGDDATLAGALLAGHDTAWVPGMAALRRAIATEMGTVARRAGDHAFEAEACLLRASAGLELGDPAALVDLDEFSRLGAVVGQPHVDYLVLTRRVTRTIMAGRFDEAEELLEAAARLADSLGEPDAWNVRTSQLWIMRTLQGRRAEIETRLRSCAVPQLKSWFDGLVGLAVLERGGGPDAERLMRSALKDDVAQLPLSYVIAAQWADLGEAATALGERAEIERYHRALLPYAGDAVVIAAAVGFGGAVDHHLGLLAGALGRHDEAVERLERAAELHERLAAWPWLAHSRCALAAALVARDRPGDHERATRLSAEVRDAAAELGLVGLLRRLDRIAVPHENVFCRDGETWRIEFAGTVVRLRDVKGLADLAVLIRSAGQDVPATTLTGVLPAAARHGSDPVLDRQARHAYRARLTQLEADLDDADRMGDDARSEALTAERAFLVRELSAAVGLGGRERGLGDERERARKAVAARIKEAIQRIDRADPALAAHLRQSVTTGTCCSYRPNGPIRWRC